MVWREISRTEPSTFGTVNRSLFSVHYEMLKEKGQGKENRLKSWEAKVKWDDYNQLLVVSSGCDMNINDCCIHCRTKSLTNACLQI